MLPPGKQEQLNTFLAGLPEGVAAQLARVVEVDRLAGGTGLPHELLLDALRPKLPAMIERRLRSLDSHLALIRAARSADFHADALISALRESAALSEAIAGEVEILRDPKWSRRLAQARTALAQAAKIVLERAPIEIAGALPAAKIGGFGTGPWPIDLSHAPEPDKIARAMCYATVLNEVRGAAAAGGFTVELETARRKTAEWLKPLSEDLLRELRAARPDSRAEAERYLSATFELFALVLGEKDAESLRRRAHLPACVGEAASARQRPADS